MDTVPELFHPNVIKKPSNGTLEQKYLIMYFFFSLKRIEFGISSGSIIFQFYHLKKAGKKWYNSTN